LQGFDVLMLDTAGRLHVDQALMDEMKAVAEVSVPQEVLLVADSMTGQDAVNVAKSFVDQIALTGVILTRMDGDARGGAALSMRAVAGKPIKFAGTGEGIDKLEPFHPERVAGRILGMGDVVSLVERAQESINAEDAEAMARKMAKGQFDLNDLRGQLAQMQRMGGLGALAGMMPGLGKMKNQINQSGVLEGNVLGRLDAIIGSMTKKERTKPELLNAKRKIRVANGSGTTVQEVNKLLKMHQEMANAMKKLRKMGGLGKLGALFGGGGGGGAGGMGGLGGLFGGGAGGGGGGMGGMGGLPPGGLPGLPGSGGAPFNLPKNFKK
jgi:signal recognition particle subunit SRP54